MKSASSPSTGRVPPVSTRRQRGFSLVELMVTITVAAILLMVAFPSFRWMYNVNRLAAPANEMVATLQVARMEAIRRNARTVVCRSENANVALATCSAAAGSWGGWIAFVDNGDNGTGVITAANAKNGQHDSGETLLRSAVVSAPIQVRPSAALTAESNRVNFRSDGLARTAASGDPYPNLTVSVCIPGAGIGQNAREVRMVGGGRVSVTRVATTGELCNAPPDAGTAP